MRAGKLGRWVGRLVVVAAFGVAATIAGVAAANTDEPDTPSWEDENSPDTPSWEDENSPDTASWE